MPVGGQRVQDGVFDGSRFSVCSADLLSVQFWTYTGGNVNGTGTQSGPYDMPTCSQYTGFTQRQWCSLTDDCTDEPVSTPVIRTNSRPLPLGSN